MGLRNEAYCRSCLSRKIKYHVMLDVFDLAATIDSGNMFPVDTYWRFVELFVKNPIASGTHFILSINPEEMLFAALALSDRKEQNFASTMPKSIISVFDLLCGH